MDNIKINKGLEFDFFDLMIDIDINQEFTLRDVLAVCKNSKIPIEILQEMVQCRHLQEYYDEIDIVKEEADETKIEYLELYWIGDVDTYENKRSCYSSWSFHGIGEEGVIPDDIFEHYSQEEIQKLKDERFRQAYAIELTPLYNIADLPIQISSTMNFVDWDKEYPDSSSTVEFRPSITLLELLHGIFWKLSYFGDTQKRNEQLEELNSRVSEFKEEINAKKGK